MYELPPPFRLSHIAVPPPLKVEVHLGTVVHDVFGTTEGDIPDGGSPLTGVLVRNDAGEKEVPLRGLFYAIGHRPNTGLFGVSLSMRDRSCVRWHILLYIHMGSCFVFVRFWPHLGCFCCRGCYPGKVCRVLGSCGVRVLVRVFRWSSERELVMMFLLAENCV